MNRNMFNFLLSLVIYSFLSINASANIVVWYVHLQDKWMPYSAENIKIIEEGYQKFLEDNTKVRSGIFIGGNNAKYFMDFRTMPQNINFKNYRQTSNTDSNIYRSARRIEFNDNVTDQFNDVYTKIIWISPQTRKQLGGHPSAIELEQPLDLNKFYSYPENMIVSDTLRL